MIDRDIDRDIDPKLEQHLRDMLGAVAAATPTEPGALAERPPQRRMLRPVTIAAALLVVAAAIGAVLAIRERGGSTNRVPTSNATPAVTPVSQTEISMLPPVLPAGLSLTGDVLDSVLTPDHIQRRVFARVAAPDDTTTWISVWFSVDQLQVSCADQPGAQTFTIGDLAASTCSLGGPWLHATWTVGSTVIFVSASSGVARNQLVSFAQSLNEAPVTTSDSALPDFDLETSPDADWVALAGSDVTQGATIRQTQWIATPTNSSEHGTVQVWVWNGAPAAAKYVIQEPLDVERVPVDETEGFLSYDSKGSPLAVWWTRDDGLVVLVTQSGMLDRKGLLDFAASLRPADPSALQAFAAAGGVEIVAPTP